MTNKCFTVTGMTCAACSAHVEKAVNALDGASNVSVNLLTNTLRLCCDENILSDNDIIAAVQKAGYGIATESEVTNAKKSRHKKSLPCRTSCT